jgi:hypothetical protein
MARKTPNTNGLKILSASERKALITPVRVKATPAERAAAIDKAANSVSAKASIDFVRSVRGK